MTLIPIPSLDEDLQLPDSVRAVIAANLVDTSKPEGAALYAAFVAGKTRPAEGTQTTGQNIVIGAFGQIQPGGATNSVSGGSPNYENAIGGNAANVNTPASNVTGAPTLVAPNGNWNSIWGGYDNVVNGWACQVQGYHTVINTDANHCTIGGGSAHVVNAGIAYGTIGGGTNHTLTGSGGTVAGGNTNSAGVTATVGGGLVNSASGANSTVSGGTANTASASQSTVGGGNGNQATGSGATVAGGSANTAGNISSTVGGGSANNASGNGATISGGLTNTASGTSATVLGGRDSVASASYSTAWGREALADVIGMTAYASGKFTVVGDAQAVNYVLRKETTDATPALMFTDGVATHMAIPTDTTIAFEILLVARRTDADGESAAYKITGCVDRGAGSTAALVGTPTITALAEDNAAWDVTVAAATSGTLRITVTGEAGKTIRWVARSSLVSVTG